MEQVFRLRIEDGRTTTVPQHLLNILRLREGDELRIITDNHKLLRVESKQNHGKSKGLSAQEKAEVLTRVEDVKSKARNSEEDLFRALEDDAVAATSA